MLLLAPSPWTQRFPNSTVYSTFAAAETDGRNCRSHWGSRNEYDARYLVAMSPQRKYGNTKLKCGVEVAAARDRARAAPRRDSGGDVLRAAASGL